MKVINSQSLGAHEIIAGILFGSAIFLFYINDLPKNILRSMQRYRDATKHLGDQKLRDLSPLLSLGGLKWEGLACKIQYVQTTNISPLLSRPQTFTYHIG